MKQAAVLILTLSLLAAGAANAFDGERKGFVIGGGVGYASSIKTTVDVSASQGFGNEFYLGTLENDEGGIAGQLMLGVAFDERNMLVLESNLGHYTVSNVDLYGDGFVYDVQFLQGVSTVSWYHYWGRTGASFFTAVGGGISYFDTDYTEPNDNGLAWQAGVGYEFTPHVQIGAYFSGGQSTFTEIPGLKGDFTQSNVAIVLTAVAF
ncbi:porin family protein [bacterium]|nr:porin family protein [bacterium]